MTEQKDGSAQGGGAQSACGIEAAAEKIIESHIRMLDIGCGDEFRIPDALATVRKEKSLAAANDLIGCIAAWAAADIAKLVPAASRTPAECSALPDEEADGKEAIRLLDQWTETEGAEDRAPYQDTMALLGKENSAGWVWAREVRYERDFDAERERTRKLAMEAVTTAEAEAACLRAQVESARNSVVDECAKVAEADYGLGFMNAKNRQAARDTARLIARQIRGLSVPSTVLGPVEAGK